MKIKWVKLSLFLSLPCFSLITACGTHSEVVGDSQITAIDVTATTDTKSMIKVEQETTWNILNDTYTDVRFVTKGESESVATYDAWSALLLKFSVTIQFQKTNFSNDIWQWLNQPGEYSLNNDGKPLNQIFDPRQAARLQIYFDCYDEVSATTPLDPYSFRTKQVPFILSSVANVTQPASSSDVNDPHTSSLNQYLTLKILPGNDENVLWNLTWDAPFVNFINNHYDASTANAPAYADFNNLQFKLMSDISDTAIVTPNGDVIKLEVPKDSNIYFALQSKKWT